MFKIEVFEKRGDYFFIKIACQYIQSEVITEERLCTSKTKAMMFYSGIATEFLQGQIDEFIKIVRYIKPHYFDKTTVPYMLMAHDWRTAYWRLTCELSPKFQQYFFQPGAYALAVKNNISIFSDLIPTLPELGKLELETMLQDITTLSAGITQTLLKIKQLDNRLIDKKTA